MNVRKIFRKRIIIPVVVVAIVVVYIVAKGNGDEQNFDYIIAERSDIAHEVSVTGNVKAAQSVDLAFETSGRVQQVSAKVGDKVAVGMRLLALENGVLSAQLLQAQANLEAEQARLNELKRGTRPEEIQSSQTAVANAERALADDRINYNNVEEKADADLNSDYDAALTALQKAVSIGKTALFTLTEIQYDHFLGSDNDSSYLTDAKADAVLALLGANGAGKWAEEYIAELKGGAFGDVQSAVENPADKILVDTALLNTMSALQSVKDALNTVPIIDELSSTDKTSLSTEKTNIATEITSVSSKEQTIAVQKISNQNAIAAAQESVNTAQNALLSAQDTLALKQAGSTPEQIAAQEAKTKSAQANVQNYQAQVGKTILRSPIAGVVTKQDAKVGEIISANTTLVSIISEAEFEIEANVAEVDIASLAIGNTSDVTLDAYGNDEKFQAQVIAIDPAETVIEGVSTYKVTLQFTTEDERIKSGLTANIDILTDTRENVIAVPQRAIVRRNGEKMVRVLKGEEMQEVGVEIGLRSSDGRIEIVSGIEEGDKVVTFIED